MIQNDQYRQAEASMSGVSWPAIIGGAFASAALFLVLVALGSGFGFASVSPWSNAGISLTTFTITAAIWLIVVQWLSAGVGGYLTGRLRTKWAGLHTHEVFFRDTANGFLSWAVGTVITAAFLASAVTSIAGGITQVAAGAASGVGRSAGEATAQTGRGAMDAVGYFVDTLYRTDHHAQPATNQEVETATARILLTSLQSGGISPADKTYLGQLVSARTGLSQSDASKRVDDVIAAEKEAEVKLRATADTVRKAASRLTIFTGLSMLIGAFIACVAAAVGGQQRDQHA